MSSRLNLRHRKLRTRAGMIGCVGLLLAVAQHENATKADNKPLHYQNADRGVGYVGSRACAQCHPRIYQSFIKTDMGRSMSLPDDPAQLATTSKPITIEVEKLHRTFQVFRQGADIDQSEYELGPDGKEAFRATHKIDYVIGAGTLGFTYVVKRGNFLFEAPLSYYSQSKSWGPSPGYQNLDYGFSRPILPVCISCHSGLPQPVPHRQGLFEDPPFREMSIGCENCHGPGELHVESLKAGKTPGGRIDPTIVNPADLPPWLTDNVCMKCHQGGDTRVLQPGMSYSDFHPGTPLNDTVAVFAVPFTAEQPPESPLLQHYELMILSKCYRASGGKLHCLTCHDPHDQSPTSEAPAYYRKKCFFCHTDKSCTLSLAVRLQQHPSDNCIGCHMPKEKLTAISHSALSNHRIIARQGEPFPEAAYRQTTPQLPDLIHLDAIPGSKTPLPPIVLLQAYSQLLDEHPEFRSRYLAILQQLEQTDSDNPLVLSAKAQQESAAGTPEASEAARDDLERAIKLGSTEPSDYQLYADALAQSGDLEGAIDALKRGIALDPYYRRFYMDLTMRYAAAQKYDEAAQTMRDELDLFPEDPVMRKVLNTVQGDGAAR
jgi:hypothetical protein